MKWERLPLHGLYLLAGLAIVCTVATYLGRYFWAFELAQYFALHSALTLGITALIFLAVHRRGDALVAFCFSLLGLVYLISLYAPAEPSTACAATHRLLLTNLLKENQRYATVRSYIRSLNPEIVVFQEVTPIWDTELEKLLHSGYSLWISEPSLDHTGIGVLSRIPLSRVEIENLGEGSPPSVQAEFDLVGERVLLIGTHPGPPYGPMAMEIKAHHFEVLSETVRSHFGPVIVLGDLNMTARSSLWQRFLRETDLRDSRQGYGLQPTYPVGFPSIFSIPLDHALISSEFAVLDRALGPDIGSDHYPVELVVGIDC